MKFVPYHRMHRQTLYRKNIATYGTVLVNDELASRSALMIAQFSYNDGIPPSLPGVKEPITTFLAAFVGLNCSDLFNYEQAFVTAIGTKETVHISTLQLLFGHHLERKNITYTLNPDKVFSAYDEYTKMFMKDAALAAMEGM